jgi:hypothetical protein
MIIVMTESSDQERESIRKDLGKVEEEPKEVVVDVDRQVREEKKPRVLDYKSEDGPAVAKPKTHPAEGKSGEEKIQENYKTPDQVLDEDYKVAPTSADKERISNEKQT